MKIEDGLSYYLMIAVAAAIGFWAGANKMPPGAEASYILAAVVGLTYAAGAAFGAVFYLILKRITVTLYRALRS